MKPIRLFLTFVLFAISLAFPMRLMASVKLPDIFTDGLCLQRDKPVPVWGTADPGEVVTVTIQSQRLQATADTTGNWRVVLAPLPAGGPIEMDIAGKNTIKFPNTYVGDVWLCYGQSNMQFEIYRSTVAADVAKESNSNLRIVHYHRPWGPAEGDYLQKFSVVGYYFGKNLQQQLKIPIGLIYGGEGGTPAEDWMPTDTLKSLGYTGSRLPKLFFNDRVLPLGDYAIKGCIWYQGENNAGYSQNYTDLMTALIGSWRKQFNQGDFPFLFVQLARIGGHLPVSHPNPYEPWALLRDAQTATLRVPNTGMVVGYDMTNGNIHPPDKHVLGERLALLARNKVYGETPSDAFTCPVFDRAERQGNSIVLHFKNAAMGLKLQDGTVGANGVVTLSPGSKITDLSLVYADGTNAPANATIDGSTVRIDLTGAKELPGIYYAWNAFPTGNLYNTAGLPVSPFRIVSTDAEPDRVDGKTITLAINGSIDASDAIKPASYTIANAQVLSAAKTSGGIALTTDHAWFPGDAIDIKFPGLKAWDNTTPLPELAYDVVPGRMASAGLIDEFLVGAVKQNADMKTAIDDPTAKTTSLAPAIDANWKPVRATDGKFDLAAATGAGDSSVAYAATNIYAAEDTPVELWLGGNDGLEAWLNGVVVSTRPNRHFPLAPDVSRTRGVKLNKGWNTLIIESAHISDEWQLYARIVAPGGYPVRNVSLSTTRPAP